MWPTSAFPVTTRIDDLERQKQVLELYCARQGWTFEVIADLGSGMDYHKGLKRLLDATQVESATSKPSPQLRMASRAAE